MYVQQRHVAGCQCAVLRVPYIYTCRHGGADIYRAGDVQVDVHEHHVVDVQASAVNEDVGILSEALVSDIAQCIYKTPVCDVAGFRRYAHAAFRHFASVSLVWY